MVTIVSGYAYTWPIGVGPALAVGLLLAAWAAWLYSGRRWAAAMAVPLLLRLLGSAVLVWLLCGPERVTREAVARPTVPTVQVVMDRSASMAAEHWDQASRLAAAVDAVQREATGALGTAQLQVLIFAEAVDRLSGLSALSAVRADGVATDLAVATAVTGEADAVVLLSDGHPQPAGALPDLTRLAAGPPIFGVTLGRTSTADGRPTLRGWADADVLWDDQPTTLRALVQVPEGGGDWALELWHEQRMLERQRLAGTQAGEIAVEQRVTPPRRLDAGDVEIHHYRWRLRPLNARAAVDQGPGDVAPDAQADVFVQVTRRRLNVLLLEGQPYWDTQALARLLRADPQVALSTVHAGRQGGPVVRLAAGQTAELLAGGRLNPLALERVDMVVLGGQVERLMDPAGAAALVAWVRRGGAVVMTRGRPAQARGGAGRAGAVAAALEPLDPVAWGESQLRRLRLAASDDAQRVGLGGAWFEHSGAGLQMLSRVEGLRAATLVLAQQAQDGPSDGAAGSDLSASTPAVVTMQVGRGRVMAVLGEQLWRWGRREALAGPAGTLPYAAWWTRVVQWLAHGGEFLPGQRVTLRADRLSMEVGDSMPLRVLSRYAEADLPLRLTVEAPDGAYEELAVSRSGSGDGLAVFEPQQAGLYEARLETPGRPELVGEGGERLRLAVRQPGGERHDVRPRPDIVRAIAEASGGAVMRVDDWSALEEHLAAVRTARQPADEPPVQREPAWRHAWVLAAVLLGFGGEWLVRRAGGLR
jgi:hypothetical protein